MLEIARETPDQPEVGALLAKADARSQALYPAESRNGLALPELLVTEIRFFVARQDGVAAGCGGYMLLPGNGAELKRLFVNPTARGRGIGAAIVQAIEAAARDEGVGTMWLETGIKSAEALRLYRRLGFTPCPPFAAYRPDPLSVFMVKPLR